MAMCLVHFGRVGSSRSRAAQSTAEVFRIENVDVNTGAVKKDKVITSWLTNTTYIVSILGNVILLDSYISRPELPTTPIDRRYAPFLPAGPHRRQTGGDFSRAWTRRPCA